MRLSKYKKAVIAIIIADIIWGAGPPIFKWSMLNIHIFTLAFLRFSIPTMLIAIFGAKYIKLKIKDAFLMFLIGITNITLNIGLYFIGIKFTESINVPVIACAGPVFLIIGSILFLGDHPSRKVLLGNLIGLTGVLLIVVQPVLNSFHTGSTSVLGNVLLILSAISSVIGTILAKKIIKKYHPMTITFWSFFVGTISFLPFFISEIMTYGFLPNFSPQGFIGILWGSIFSSLLAYFLLYWGLNYIKASEISVFTYIDPVSAILIAAPLLGEYPSPIFITGTFFVFFGVFIAEGRIHYHPLHKLFLKSYALD